MRIVLRVVLLVIAALIAFISSRPNTFHVERSVFDQILLDHARNMGVEVRMNATVLNPIKDGERIVGVTYRETEAGEPDAAPAAHFVCALAIAWPNDGQTETFEGRVDGTLVWPPRGGRGRHTGRGGNRRTGISGVHRKAEGAPVRA